MCRKAPKAQICPETFVHDCSRLEFLARFLMHIYTDSVINNLLILLAVHYRVMVQLRSLKSTQEARLAVTFLSSLFQALGSWDEQ